MSETQAHLVALTFWVVQAHDNAHAAVLASVDARLHLAAAELRQALPTADSVGFTLPQDADQAPLSVSVLDASGTALARARDLESLLAELPEPDRASAEAALRALILVHWQLMAVDAPEGSDLQDCHLAVPANSEPDSPWTVHLCLPAAGHLPDALRASRDQARTARRG